jgi:hypothetical protein
MTQKRIIASIIGIILVIGVALGVRELLRYHTISFTFASTVSSIDIYEDTGHSDKPSVAAHLSSSGSARLKEGKYYLIPKGRDIAQDKISLSVSKDETIAVDPSYSAQYLRSLATAEQPAVASLLTKQYPAAMANYEIDSVTLYQKGEWAGVVLTPKGMDRQNPSDYYRVVAQKTNGVWKVISSPQVVLTLDNTPGVPRSILIAVNTIGLR